MNMTRTSLYVYIALVFRVGCVYTLESVSQETVFAIAARGDT